MDKKKIILGVLAAVAVFVWARGLKTHSRRVTRPDIINKETIISPSSGAIRKQKSRTIHTNWGRNPFSAVRSVSGLSSGLQLSGIIFDEQGGYAVLNDQICHIGDTIDGKKIVDIKQDRVILNDGTKDFEVKLGY